MTSDPSPPTGHPPAPGTSPRPSGLRALLVVFGSAGLCAALTYLHPALAELRPWVPGDPPPVFSKLLPQAAPRVTEDDAGAPVVAEEPPPPAPVPAAPGPAAVTLPEHPPGVPTAVVDADHRGLDHFFRALALAETGKGIARASHWGDSTIAADGITSTIRRRLQEKYGNAGPGYLSAGLDPQWSLRPDVGVGRDGEWQTVSLLNGGGNGRYGFGGIAATALPGAKVSLSAPKLADGTRQKLQHFELYYQANPTGGGWWASLDGRGVGSGSANAAGTVDRFLSVDRPEGYSRVGLGASDSGPATFYGVVMETAGPGVVWDALGVVGVGTHSFNQQGRKHLSAQVARRKPDLVVLMLGGNELGAPTLAGDGMGWAPYFAATLDRLRAGAPESSCLVVTPLDQGTRVGGKVKSKPNLVPMIAAQRAVAAQYGCAFWDARAAMGGEGAIARWLAMKPPLAWTDLLHLSGEGQDIIGQLFADALIAEYEDWKAKGGTSRPLPTPPGPPVDAAPAAGDAAEVPEAATGDAGEPPAAPTAPPTPPASADPALAPPRPAPGAPG